MLFAKTVTDMDTKLIWLDDIDVKIDRREWQGAMDHCNNLSLAGYDDWRLPTRMELLGIADKSKYNPAIKPGFKYVDGSCWLEDGYWSSSEFALNKPNELRKYAWFVSFCSGKTDYTTEVDPKRVRCVRDIQEDDLRNMVTRWIEAQNKKDLNKILELYAPNVKFQGKSLTAEKMIDIKNLYIRDKYIKHQDVTGIITCNPENNPLHYRCDFTIRMNAAYGQGDFPYYLIIDKSTKEPKIIEEMHPSIHLLD